MGKFKICICIVERYKNILNWYVYCLILYGFCVDKFNVVLVNVWYNMMVYIGCIDKILIYCEILDGWKYC